MLSLSQVLAYGLEVKCPYTRALPDKVEDQ